MKLCTLISDVKLLLLLAMLHIQYVHVHRLAHCVGAVWVTWWFVYYTESSTCSLSLLNFVMPSFSPLSARSPPSPFLSSTCILPPPSLPHSFSPLPLSLSFPPPSLPPISHSFSPLLFSLSSLPLSLPSLIGWQWQWWVLRATEGLHYRRYLSWHSKYGWANSPTEKSQTLAC